MPTRLHFAIIFALCALSPTGVFAQEVCGCNDLAQIEYRIREAKVTVDVIREYVDSVGSMELNTDASYGRSMNNLQHNLDSFADGSQLKPGNPGGEQAHTSYTAEKGCHTDWPLPTLGRTSVSDPLGTTEVWTGWAATDCMNAATDAHEKVHREVCEEFRRVHIPRWIFLKDKLEEEIDAYTAERKYLLEQRQRLLCSCDYYSVRLKIDTNRTPMRHSIGGHVVLYSTVHAELPHVDVPMHINDVGWMKGDSEGVMRGTATSFVPGGPVSDAVDLSLEFHISASSSASPEQVHTTIQIVTKEDTNRTGGKTLRTQGPFSNDWPVDFSQLDTAIVRNVPHGHGSWTYFSATLMVAEQYRDAKAANNKGSTVGEALNAIAGADHTLVASCPQTK
ncbi:MAG TPA: hypothetical protein VNX26_05400 [Candidatus Acidoferrum sp.]|jgi:hypothetical protein|nr:hypothetical protein [Candidatus Acidoferrum sp.]